jgi:predicted RNA-binding Zn-ribbon protein involved in translation (DUF1610 family)
MTCKHLKALYDVCQSHQLRITSMDLIRIVCPQCGVEEVCPSVLSDEYDKHHPSESAANTTGEDAATDKKAAKPD